MESYIHRRIHDLLVRAHKPVFISDERTDGDSLGASLAIADFMRGRGVTVPVFVSEPVPEKYLSMPNIDLCTDDPVIFDDPEIDLVISFDCSDANYVNKLIKKIAGDVILINIDHHATNSNYGHLNQVIVESPATAEVVHGFFKENQIVPSRDAATCLLAGICFDTTIFQNSATNPRALDAASSLILSGAHVQDVIQMLFQNRSVNALRIWGIALERLYHHPELGTVSTFLTRADIEGNGVTDEEVDGLSDFLNLVTDADTLLVLRETNRGDIKVSMRTQSQNVASVAKAFGGGGHVKAAGFTLPKVRFSRDTRTGQWKIISTD